MNKKGRYETACKRKELEKLGIFTVENLFNNKNK